MNARRADRSIEKPRLGLRERTRRAVRSEIAEAAGTLFLQKGFTATTVDEVASAAGMSPRSVFRYFPTKEDLILAKLDMAAEEVLKRLAERPVDEPEWVSLRRMFDPFAIYDAEPERYLVAEPIQRVVFETPALFARYLLKLDGLQEGVTATLLQRRSQRDRAVAARDTMCRAIVAAAFGCLVAAQHAWLAGNAQTSMADTIDLAMGAVMPLSSDEKGCLARTRADSGRNAG